MAGLKEKIQGPPVHGRRMEIRSFPLEDGSLIVEGWLLDQRHVPGYHWDGRPRPPGVVHQIGVRLLVGGWPLKILDVEAEMPQVPHERCPEAQRNLKEVVGLTIVHGYSEQIRRRLGGVKGCNHLTHLLLVMGTAALHGYWTRRSQTPRPRPKSLKEVPGLDTIVNSCHLWGVQGPLMEELRRVIETDAQEEINGRRDGHGKASGRDSNPTRRGGGDQGEL